MCTQLFECLHCYLLVIELVGGEFEYNIKRNIRLCCLCIYSAIQLHYNLSKNYKEICGCIDFKPTVLFLPISSLLIFFVF